jgi:Rap1a immunity proteins
MNQATAIVAGIILILAFPAEAEFMDGYELLQKCRLAETEVTCLGYIEGCVDGLNSASRALISTMMLCLPEIKLGQARLIVQRHLERHPQDLHKPAADLVLVGLSQAFPCKSR